MITLTEFTAERSRRVARGLLGSVVRLGPVAVRLTEVEAYEGTDDPASHAFRGPTPRNQVMFGPSGRLYVYFSYGMHHAVNIVCGPDGTASAVLLRAGEVVAGVDEAIARRGTDDLPRLARGPGNLAKALGLVLADSGRWPDEDPELAWTPAVKPGAVRSGPRVGVSRAADVRWRWWLANDPTVSAYKRSPRAPEVPPRAS